MRSDIHDIGIQLLKQSDIYSWIVIFGHKRPNYPIFPPSEYIYVKQTSMSGIPCLYPVNLWLGWGPPWTCDFLYCVPCVFVYVDQCSTY